MRRPAARRRILDRCKDVGVYDNSLIVDLVRSWHRIRAAEFRERPADARRRVVELAGKSMALLIVKAPGSRGPVRVSHAPTTISDIAATVLDAAGVPHTLPGEPALKLAERRAARSRVRHVRLGRRWLEADLFRRARYAWRFADRRARWEQLDAGRQPLSARRWTRTSARAACTRCSGADPGSIYRWSSPHGFFHAPPEARSFEIEDPIDRAEAANRHVRRRRSGARHDHARAISRG